MIAVWESELTLITAQKFGLKLGNSKLQRFSRGPHILKYVGLSKFVENVRLEKIT